MKETAHFILPRLGIEPWPLGLRPLSTVHSAAKPCVCVLFGLGWFYIFSYDIAQGLCYKKRSCLLHHFEIIFFCILKLGLCTQSHDLWYRKCMLFGVLSELMSGM